MPDKMITKLERKLKKEHLFTRKNVVLTGVEGFISDSQSLEFLGLLGKKQIFLYSDFFPITCLWWLFNIKFPTNPLFSCSDSAAGGRVKLSSLQVGWEILF